MSALGHADRRPRVHIWPNRETGECRISAGPIGKRSSQRFQNIPHAVEGALMHFGDVPMVIIVEPNGG